MFKYMYRYTIISDKERLESVAVTSLILCFVLIIFPALNISSVFGDIFADKDAPTKNPIHLVGAFLVFIAMSFQFYLLFTIKDHPVNKSIFAILYILLLSSATTVIEISLVSRIAAILNLILWVLVIGIIVNINSEEICKVDAIVLKRFWIFIATICVSSLVWNAKCIWHVFDP